MDNIRIFLWAGLALLIWMTYMAWQAQYAPSPQPVQADAPQDTEDQLPAISETSPGSATAPADLPDLPGIPGEPSGARVEAAGPAASANMIHVRTDVLDIEIDLRGGDIHTARLPAYPLRKDEPDVPVTLLTSDPERLFIFRSGLRAFDNAPEANHLSTFEAERDRYELEPGADELTVVLSWSGADGISTDKIYKFGRGRYDIGFEQVVRNEGNSPYRAVSYQQIQRRHNPPERSMFDVDSYSYMGPVLYDGDKYEKLDAEDLAEEPFQQVATNGWSASIQHHFLAAIVPPAEEETNYQATYDGRSYVLSMVDGQPRNVPAGSTEIFSADLYVGPKLQKQLSETADSLSLTVDYGIFTVLAQPLFWLLQKIYNFVGNWGWSIIFLTFLIKLMFYKLTEASGRSMAKMRKLQPRLKALQERYKDDREALSKAMMELYKREKVNPAAGCLPVLIQIPFFMAFYWVLLESVEMRQAPFMLWITDLSTRDPFFILPVLMGGVMFFQQKLNPAPPDPMQAKIMQFLPIMFTGMFAFFPAGLVLYWLTNSVLSVAQQWRINKVVGAD
jgi:YidC/Oxa1 family membrane protein insertase